MASRNGSAPRRQLGLADLADLTDRAAAADPAPPPSMAAHFARLAELASMRATIAQEEAQNLADLARIADIHLAGSPQQSVTSTVPEAPSKNAAAAPAQDRALLTKQGVATVLDCHPRTVRRMELAGELPAPVLVGRLLRWRREDLDRLIAAQSPAPRRHSP